MTIDEARGALKTLGYDLATFATAEISAIADKAQELMLDGKQRIGAAIRAAVSTCTPSKAKAFAVGTFSADPEDAPTNSTPTEEGFTGTTGTMTPRQQEAARLRSLARDARMRAEGATRSGSPAASNWARIAQAYEQGAAKIAMGAGEMPTEQEFQDVQELVRQARQDPKQKETGTSMPSKAEGTFATDDAAAKFVAEMAIKADDGVREFTTKAAADLASVLGIKGDEARLKNIACKAVLEFREMKTNHQHPNGSRFNFVG